MKAVQHPFEPEIPPEGCTGPVWLEEYRLDRCDLCGKGALLHSSITDDQLLQAGFSRLRWEQVQARGARA